MIIEPTATGYVAFQRNIDKSGRKVGFICESDTRAADSEDDLKKAQHEARAKAVAGLVGMISEHHFMTGIRSDIFTREGVA